MALVTLSVSAASACRGDHSRSGEASVSELFPRTLQSNPSGCVDHFDPTTDYFPDKATIEAARQVAVTYHGHYKVVTVTFRGFADNPNFNSVERYVLVQCGTPPPALDGPLAGASIITIPAKTVTVTSNEDLGMMLALGMRNEIKSVGSRAIWDDELWRKFKAGKLMVTYGWGTSEIHVEWMLNLKPDVVIIGAFQSQVARNMQRAREVGLQTLPSLTRVEPTPLGRAEWIKALAAAFNLEARANRFYADVAANYRRLAERVQTSQRKPAAFWASTYAAGTWSAARNSFQARLLEDAGAVNALADNGPTFSVTVGPEVIVDRAAEADYWITENSNLIQESGRVTVPATPLDALLAVRLGHVYHLARRLRAENQGCDYYQTGPARPDIVLEDLISVFHPDLEIRYAPFFVAPMPPAIRGLHTASH